MARLEADVQEDQFVLPPSLLQRLVVEKLPGDWAVGMALYVRADALCCTVTQGGGARGRARGVLLLLLLLLSKRGQAGATTGAGQLGLCSLSQLGGDHDVVVMAEPRDNRVRGIMGGCSSFFLQCRGDSAEEG